MTTPACPECERLHEVAPFSQRIGDFLDWLENEKHWMIAKYHEHDEECEDENGSYTCGFFTDAIQIVHTQREKLLAEFFGIDLTKVENERRALLESLGRALLESLGNRGR
jgi:hypothetical protein